MKMFLTLFVATVLGCLTAAFIESGSGHDAEAVTEKPRDIVASAAASAREIPVPEEDFLYRPAPRASFPTSELPEKQPEVRTVGSDPRRVAAFCDTLDLVERPDLADEMVKLASGAYGTPAGLLNGIWHTESHHGIDGQTGTCKVMEQYAIRDCWFPGKGTKRPKGCESPYVFAGESPSDTRWKEPSRSVGKGTVQRQSIIRIAKALGISPWSIKGSCGRSKLHGRPDHRPTFGGCFGNMQITPSEWEADVLAMGFGLSELDPFNVCDSLLVSSYRLRKHHDQKLARYAKSSGTPGTTARHDQLSWLWAGRRYYGSPDRWTSNKYERIFKHGRPNATFRCGWQCWDRMAVDGDFSELTDYIRKRGSRIRRRYATN